MNKGLRFVLGSGLIFAIFAAALAEPLSLVTNHGNVLAYTDGDVPGMSATTFGSSMAFPVVAEDGTVLFLSNLAGPGITPPNSRALFEGTTFADLSVVAQWSDAAPALPGLRLINNSGGSGISSNALRISPDGRSFFTSRLTNAGNNLPTTNDTALFGGFAGSLALVAREGNPAPGTAGAVFGDLMNLSIQYTSINRNGRVLFQAPLVGGDVVGATNNVALYTGTAGALTIAARKGQTMLPGLTAAAFSGNTLMTGDRILYNLQLAGAGVTTANDESIWLYTPGSGNALLVREGNTAPGTSGAVFSGELIMSSNSVSGNGRFEFTTSLAGGSVTPANNQAIYIADTAGAVTLLARKGAAAPGTSATFMGFNQFFSFVNGAGVGVFQAQLTGGGVNSTNDNGIWAGTPGSLSLVARAGITPIQGVDGGAVCAQIISHPMVFSDYGFVLSCDIVGQYVFPGRNSKALVAWTPTKGLFLVWRQGQNLEVAPGVSRPQTLAGGLVQMGNSDGAALGLSHDGTLAINVYLDPGVSEASVDLDCYPTTDYYVDSDGDGHGNPATEINLCAGGTPPSGYITTSGDCLDSNPSAQGASTEICNGIDDDCDARIDDGIPHPTGVLTIKIAKSFGITGLTWNAVPNATQYDVIFGDLGELRAAGGHYQFLSQAICWANDFTGTSMTMPGNPSAGKGQWWLMRAVGCSGLGSFDEGVPSQVSTRDQEINPAQYACP